METSKFQFSEPVLIDMKFHTNEDFKPVGEGEPMKVNLQIKNVIRKEREKENAATVDVTVSMGENGSSIPFILSITMRADFRWEEDAFSEETVKSLLKQNATATLLSYIRPLVATITNASPYNAYNIPYIDLTKGGAE
jgi:preprotein translocase subunit SecB